MCTKIKVWKPGQLVTINGKVYRVVKGVLGCKYCYDLYTKLYNFPCVICMSHKHPYRPWILIELKPNQNK